MSNQKKYQALGFLALAVVGTILLATSLPRLRLNPGLPIPRVAGENLIMGSDERPTLFNLSVDLFFKVFFGTMLGLAAIYLVYSFLRSLPWKEVLNGLAIFVMVTGLLAGFIYLLLHNASVSALPPMAVPPPETSVPVDVPLGPAPNLLIWIVGIGLAVLAAALGVWLVAGARQPEPALQLVGLEADRARQAIRSGKDLKDVIIACYVQMSLALQQDRGLERQESMTPREFERLLEAEGVPPAPVHQLTALFEAVRYGHWRPNQKDEQQAVECLDAIVSYSRSAGQAG